MWTSVINNQKIVKSITLKREASYCTNLNVYSRKKPEEHRIIKRDARCQPEDAHAAVLTDKERQ